MPNLFSPSEIEYQSFLDDYFYSRLIFKRINQINQLILLEASDSDFRYFKLIDSQQNFLSALRLQLISFHNTKFYCINKSKSKVENRGYATLLYEFCFMTLDIPIISDQTQTKGGSSDLWNKLILKKRQYKIFSYNIKTNKYIELDHKFNPYLIWGIDDQKLLAQLETPEILFDDDLLNDSNDLDDNLDTDYSFFNDINYFDLRLLNFLKKGKIKDRKNVRLVAKM
ncbi:hypothetical protein [Flavobacterium sp. KJJ]|uniref:hypothetical protein n=1 Tax=Flavobacterium sp. KJJ TaxID=1270193 RepID=UPI0004935F64|nr:hypothetical protein [Flavobacterium sp. KJJ]